MAFRKSKKTRKKSPLLDIRGNREKLLRGGVFFLLLLACLFHIKAAFLAQLATNSSDNALYFSSELTDPNALAGLARKAHLADADLPGALSLYTRSLANFVLHIPSWLGIVELYNDMGEKDKAVAALQFVHSFAADNEKTAWTKAILAHELDQTEILTGNLVWLAEKFPAKRRQVYALADQQWPDPNWLLERFAPSLYPDILEYYININEAGKAETTWGRMAIAGTGDPKIALRYLNYLLGQEKVPEAAAIWQEYYRQEGSLLYNRELREPFIGSGFGWRISRADGVSWRPAGEDGGLRIQFDGSANVLFSLAQIVPLAPGRYVFSGTIACQDLTTDQRPYWTITGYKCEGLSVRGEMIPPSGPPDTFSLGFTVPEECHAVQIALRRNKSHYFDNQISGKLTLNGLELIAGDQPGTEIDYSGRKQGGTGGTDFGIKRLQVY
jgi:hypothetical protein